MPRPLSRETISTKQRKIATLARQTPTQVLTTLAHRIDVGWLQEAYRRPRKRSAAGVDGVTAAENETALEANLTSLLERFQSGRYRAPAVRRVHIPKAGAGRQTDAAHWHTDAGGQSPAAGGGHGAGADLRTGLSGLLVWVPAGSRRAPGARAVVAGADGHRRRLGRRPRHPALLRQRRPSPAGAGAGPAGARRRDTPCDWEVATSRRQGRRPGLVSGTGYPPKVAWSARCSRMSSSTKS